MYTERMKRWVKASRGIGRIEEFMIVNIQGLGRLDSQLIEEDKFWSEQSDDSSDANIAKSIKLLDSFTLSYLWVLGGYELIRTISQRCQERREILGEDLNQRIRKLKGDFERLRIPLAKMEPARNHIETDSPIAFPAIHKDLGISWRVSEDLYIPRRQLSDSLLSLFEDISAKLESN